MILMIEEAIAQSDSTSLLPEVVVSGFQETAGKSTSLNIEPYSLESLEIKAPQNLSDALAQIPGVSQISTGGAISKPVIRGLYGNRILVLLSGLRFDNQQWQDEHGLGLSQIGISKVEVIKGPAALLYGTDALGGVINVIEETPKFIPDQKTDLNVRLSSNTLGALTDVGYRKGTKNYWWRIRGGIENHADYSDGHGARVLNSRNTGYYLRTGLGLKGEKWTQENTYNFSYNQYGFILEGLGDFFEPDARWSREMGGPHHNVLLNILNSKNNFYLDHSVLRLNAGCQSNQRQEDEGGGQISLNMHLISFLESMRWEKPLRKRLMMIINQQFTFENNTNYGGRIIIPDANMMEGNLAAYIKYYTNRLVVETGISVANKFIQTFETRMLNSPGEEVQPFKINRPSFNGMLGLCFNPGENTNLKWNFSTGFRAPNLAELSSNGLHEGVFRYEIGDPQLKVEQNFNTDITFEYSGNQLFANASVYHNYFNNYVYLAPTNEDFFGFDVFRYRQQHSRIYGAEASIHYKPFQNKSWEFKESATATRGLLKNGENLPFIPAYQINSAIHWMGKISHFDCYWEPELQYVFPQNKPAQFETSTVDYALFNMMAGFGETKKKIKWQCSLAAKNIMNKLYADHLSRIKYYGLYNPGFNLVLSTKVTWL